MNILFFLKPKNEVAFLYEDLRWMYIIFYDAGWKVCYNNKKVFM